MISKKRVLALLTAASVTFSAAPAVLSVPVFAETYEDTSVVPGYLFETDSSSEAQEKLEKVFETATKKAIGSITFADLAKVTSLNLSGMGLEGVPEAIEYMTKLRTLNLSNNLLRSSDVNSLDLSGCTALTTVDISDNFLTTVPSWFVTLEIPTQKIDNNLINTTNQRSLTVSPSVYYFMTGEEVNENALKNKILGSVKLSDGSELPYFFYDPDYPPYNEYDMDDTEVLESYDLAISSWNLSQYIGADHIVKDVTKSSGVDVTVRLNAVSSSNPNATVSVKIYFLNGDDPSSVNVRLETLINECSTYVQTDYTATSWNNFQTVLNTATTIYGYENADVDMLKSALTALTSAQAGLIKGVSASAKTVLNSLITISGSFKESDYTSSSWAAFASAVAELKAVSTDADATLTRANAAIKAYQAAQTGLVRTSLSLPPTAAKSDFESIYGENKTVTYSGVTRDGYKYTWTFNGKDITAPKDFNPEIKYESANEEKIRIEVGSASDYQLISFTETGAFPGTAKISLDVSGKYANGTYRLYKWNTSTSKPELVDNAVTVKNGVAEITVSEGGDYFISSVLQNFEIASAKFEVDHSKLTITAIFKKKYTVTAFKSYLENGEAVNVLNADGTAAASGRNIATGMTAAAANSDVRYTVVVPGDTNGDGSVNASDAVEILKAVAGISELSDYAKRAAGDVNSDGWVRADDAVSILKYSVGIN